MDWLVVVLMSIITNTRKDSMHCYQHTTQKLCFGR